jgi:hypothetical protein
MIFKGVAVGSISAVVATIIAVTIEARNVVAAARASGFHGEVGLDLSTLLREPKFVTVAVASFAFGFYLVLQFHSKK